MRVPLKDKLNKCKAKILICHQIFDKMGQIEKMFS